MRKTLLFVILILFFVFIVVTVSGLYPVAVVGRSLVFSRTWKQAERAAENFTNSQLFLRDNGRVVDFSSSKNVDLLLEIRRNTLTFLIEDAVIRAEGPLILDNFSELSGKRVSDAIINQPNIQTAMETVYGIPFEEVRDMVLLPQARRDILQGALSQKNRNFDEWLKQEKKSKRVLLFMTPFKWNGERVE